MENKLTLLGKVLKTKMKKDYYHYFELYESKTNDDTQLIVKSIKSDKYVYFYVENINNEEYNDTNQL